MTDVLSRLTRLEERVFQSHQNQLGNLATELKELTKKLNWLIVLLAGNFGIAFFNGLKIIP